MSPSARKPSTNVLESVQNRYARGATEQVPELCCPVDYDASLLEVLPADIIDRDYGCGDPSRFVRKGDRVLDLGSGAGKICYMASQEEARLRREAPDAPAFGCCHERLRDPAETKHGVQRDDVAPGASGSSCC